MDNCWAAQTHKEEIPLAYDIGIPIAYIMPEVGQIMVGYDHDGNVYIHFETRNWTSPTYRMPAWWQLAY